MPGPENDDGRWDGDVIFKNPRQELLRLKGNGMILVQGRQAESDAEVVRAFKHWLGLIPSIAIGLPKGDKALTVSSGKGVSEVGTGGDVIFDTKTDRVAVLAKELLRIRLSAFSEMSFSCGWYSDLSRAVWRLAVKGGYEPHDDEDRLGMTKQVAAEFMELAKDAGGWWAARDEFVPIEAWKAQNP